jgi:hypothetical protein
MPIDQVIPCATAFMALYDRESYQEVPILGFALVSTGKSQDIVPLIVNSMGQIVPQDLNDETYLGVCHKDDYEAKQRLATQTPLEDDEPPIVINQFGALE